MSRHSATRREFLEFMGASTATLASLSIGSNTLWAKGISKAAADGSTLQPLPSASSDTLRLVDGLKAEVMISYGDPINKAGEAFGYDNDFTASIPLSDTEALLWVNHESVDPLLVSGYTLGGQRTKAQVDIERQAVGGSILKIRKSDDGRWRFVKDDPINRRISGTTRMRLIADDKIAGSFEAIGTLGNCSGGVTPWRTFLTCEENYDHMYGDIDFAKAQQGQRQRLAASSELGWERFYDQPPEHYGWVVEVNPLTAQCQKLTALGRFAHEGAKVTQARDGRAVVYMGDDANNQCIYKFVASKPGSLAQGTLYAADITRGRWLPLDWEKDARLKKVFKSKTEMLVWTREAAKIVGATPMDRPEGIDIQPGTGAVVVTLTNNGSKKNLFGSILRIDEQDADPLATEFRSATLVAGGPDSGFACPDNVLFDQRGNLWMVTDISEKSLNQGEYKAYGNNSLFYIPMTGINAGQPIRVATAPIDAELTGPSWSPDGSTLFLAVQHPGKRTNDLKNPTSLWPHDGSGRPKPAVVAIHGALLTKLLMS